MDLINYCSKILGVSLIDIMLTCQISRGYISLTDSLCLHNTFIDIDYVTY